MYFLSFSFSYEMVKGKRCRKKFFSWDCCCSHLHSCHYVDEKNLRVEKIKHIAMGKNLGRDVPRVYIDGEEWLYNEGSGEIEKISDLSDILTRALDSHTHILSMDYFLDRVKKYADQFTIQEEKDILVLSGKIEEDLSLKKKEKTELKKMLEKEINHLFNNINFETNQQKNGFQVHRYLLRIWVDKNTYKIRKIDSSVQGEVYLISSWTSEGLVNEQVGKKVVIKEVLTYQDAPNTIPKPTVSTNKGTN